MLSDALSLDIAAVKKVSDNAEKSNQLQGKMIAGIAVDLAGGTLSGTSTPGFGIKPRIEKLEKSLDDLDLRADFLENLQTVPFRDELRTLLIEARAYKDIATSEDNGFDLIPNTEYVTVKEKAALKAAVDKAWVTLRKEYLKLAEVKQAIEDLNIALEAFTPDIKTADGWDDMDTIIDLFSDMYDVLQDLVIADNAADVYKNQYWVTAKDKKNFEEEKAKLSWLKFPGMIDRMSYNDAEAIIEKAQKMYDAFEPQRGTKESPAKQPLAKFITKSISINETLDEVNADVPSYLRDEFDEALEKAQEVIDYEYDDDDADDEFEELASALEALRLAYEAIRDWIDSYLPGGDLGPESFKVVSMFNAPDSWNHPPINVNNADGNGFIATNGPTELNPVNGKVIFTQADLDKWDCSVTPTGIKSAAFTWYGEINKIIGKDFDRINLYNNGKISSSYFDESDVTTPAGWMCIDGEKNFI